MRHQIASLIIAAMLLVAGCSSGGSSGSSADDQTTPVGPVSTADDGPNTPLVTKAEVQRAIDAAIAGPGEFGAAVERHGETYRQWVGRYSGKQQSAVVQYQGPGMTGKHLGPGEYAILTVVDHGDVFVGTRPVGPLSSCWSSRGAKGSSVDGVEVGFPSQIGALAHLQGVTPIYLGDQADATLPLRDALPLLDPELARNRKATQGDEPVDVAIRIDDGALAEWSLYPGSVSNAARRTGVKLTQEQFSTLADERVYVVLGHLGEDVDLRFPDAAPRVSSTRC